jgi:TolB-like protein
MSFVSELRRRQVFRAAAWYGGIAWAAVEVSNTVFPQLGLPSWSVRAVIVAALLGLPVALLLAWSFDVSSAGVRREQAAPEAPAPRTAAWRTPSLWLALVLGAGLAVSAQQAWQRLVRPSLEERPGLAVLPFANLSPDPENAYFADGLHEEVLGALASLSGLRVISRTSVEQYRDPKRNLREIATALDVTLIMEGSVRRVGDDLRLSLQLIDGRRDERLWSETYDRKFRDALDLQRTVARQVAAAIGTRLTATEQRNNAQPDTDNPAAFERYLQAVALMGSATEAAQLIDAQRLLDEALALDERFARAYALRARLRISLFITSEAQPGDVERTRADVERALELQPGLPEGLVARAMFAVYVTLDPARAVEDLSRAIEVAPNDPEAHAAMGFTLRRLGRVDEAIRHFGQATALAPGDPQYEGQVAQTLLDSHRYAEADREFRTLLERRPSDPFLPMVRRYVRFAASGDAAGWREEFDRLEPALGSFDRGIVRHFLLVGTGDVAGLVAYYERTAATDLYQARDYTLGVGYTALGDPVRAEPHLRATVAAFHARIPEQGRGFVPAEAAVALELLGNHAAALTAADQAVRELSEAHDAVNASEVALKHAWVLIHSGTRAEEGYQALARLMNTYAVHPHWVAADPLWLIVRDDARVQQILRDAFPES